jgi:hypothetical protein
VGARANQSCYFVSISDVREGAEALTSTSPPRLATGSESQPLGNVRAALPPLRPPDE